MGKIMKVTFIVKLRPTEYEEEIELPDNLTRQQIEMRCKYWVRSMLEQAAERPTIDVHHVIDSHI